MDPKIDKFLKETKSWKEEMTLLRKIILECGLNEELKWRWPCYTVEGKNVVLIHGFKEYCAILFFKGALLADSKNLLKAPGSSQAGRQLRFSNAKEISQIRGTIKSYVKEAIKLEKAGARVELKETKDFDVPEEFQNKLNELPKLKKAYDALTPGRRRAYLYYFSQAKQSKTREARVEKCMKLILKGKGLND